MDRRELMRAIAVAAGLSLAAGGAVSAAPKHGIPAAAKAEPQGFLRSGNPKAAGGPANPGKGNPFNAYTG